MVSVLTSSAVDRGVRALVGSNQRLKLVFVVSVKHAELRRKSKDWLARNQNNVSEWSSMSTRGLLFQHY